MLQNITKFSNIKGNFSKSSKIKFLQNKANVINKKIIEIKKYNLKKIIIKLIFTSKKKETKIIWTQ